MTISDIFWTFGVETGELWALRYFPLALLPNLRQAMKRLTWDQESFMIWVDVVFNVSLESQGNPQFQVFISFPAGVKSTYAFRFYPMTINE